MVQPERFLATWGDVQLSVTTCGEVCLIRPTVFLNRPLGCGVLCRDFARPPKPQGLPMAGWGLRRVSDLSLQRGLLFRETTLDEAFAQRVLWWRLL